MYMTRYSDFVKRYMKKTGKSWNCAVCDIKKGDLYKGFKKDEDSQIKSDMDMMGGEDRDAPKIIKIKIKRRPVVSGQVQSETLQPSPIPPPMSLEPANPNTKTEMPLGAMPEIIGKMIQDFARPTEDTLIRKRQELPLKRNALLALLYAIRGRTNFTETESFYEIGWVDGQRENIKEKKLKAYLKKIDALIKKAKKKATIDESEVDDYFYDMSSERVAKTDDQVVAIKYLEKHDFYIKRRNIYETYRWGGEVHTTNTIDRVTWNIHYSIRNTRDMFKELTEMVKELQ